MNLVITISGGLGKQTSFSALLPALKKKYKKIYLASSYPASFIGNDNVTVLNPEFNSSFYRDLIQNKETKIVTVDPYDTEKFIKKKIHLLNCWAEMCDISVDGMNLTTELFHKTESEKYGLDSFLYALKNQTNNKFILIQMNGGQSPHFFDENNGQTPFSFAEESIKRFYPFNYYERLIKNLIKKYPEYSIVRFGLPNEPLPSSVQNDVITFQPTLYKYYREAAKIAHKVVCIDSSLQHIISGAKPAVVIWGETAPEHFGYNYHTNLRVEKEDTQPYFRLLGQQEDREIKFPTPEEVMSAVEKI